ncbi:MAG: maleylacetate reductase [Verrucomicrobia bacterium]|nr:maleylacetate reductase [Verrucomicrobiota bacterium]MBV8486047.1 maleylacetate reductase [Verrucomicrobiota bacterium]
MDNFVYEALPTRVIFGAGKLETLAAEVSRLGSKALVLCTPEQKSAAHEAAQMLGALSVGIFDRATMHVPIETARAAQSEASRLGADVYVAIGGGSTTGLGKAIALESGKPIVCVPTTYAGSEMTPIWGLTENGVKKTGRDIKVLPRTVIYDPTLTLSLPTTLSATSGMNAIAHSVEALYSQNRNPIVSLMAEESIRSLARSLPRVVQEPKNLEARSEALYGAWLAGISLGSVGMALHHKLCHTLGGSFNLPHAEVHTVIIPHVTAYNRDAAPEAMRRIAAALGQSDAAEGLFQLELTLGTPTKLSDLRMKQEDLDLAAELASQNPYYNPRPVTRGGIRALLEDAFFGNHPR